MTPIMAWNIFMADKLPNAFQPEIFQKDIPMYIVYGENFFRLMLFLLTFLMPLSLRSGTQKFGLIVYMMGLIAYLSSWLVLIYAPDSWWSNTVLGFMAPAYTPTLWLTGIMLTGTKFYFELKYSKWYFFIPSLCFLLFHNLHTWMIFNRV